MKAMYMLTTEMDTLDLFATIHGAKRKQQWCVANLGITMAVLLVRPSLGLCPHNLQWMMFAATEMKTTFKVATTILRITVARVRVLGSAARTTSQLPTLRHMVPPPQAIPGLQDTGLQATGQQADQTAVVKKKVFGVKFIDMFRRRNKTI